jgi:hypothetical protein
MRLEWCLLEEVSKGIISFRQKPEKNQKKPEKTLDIPN